MDKIKYTYQQSQYLLSVYKATPYLTPSDVEALAVQIGVSRKQIRIWFQNRRAKERREETRRQKELTEKAARADFGSFNKGAHLGMQNRSEAFHQSAGPSNYGQFLQVPGNSAQRRRQSSSPVVSTAGYSGQQNGQFNANFGFTQKTTECPTGVSFPAHAAGQVTGSFENKVYESTQQSTSWNMDHSSSSAPVRYGQFQVNAMHNADQSYGPDRGTDSGSPYSDNSQHFGGENGSGGNFQDSYGYNRSSVSPSNYSQHSSHSDLSASSAYNPTPSPSGFSSYSDVSRSQSPYNSELNNSGSWYSNATQSSEVVPDQSVLWDMDAQSSSAFQSFSYEEGGAGGETAPLNAQGPSDGTNAESFNNVPPFDPTAAASVPQIVIQNFDDFGSSIEGEVANKFDESLRVTEDLNNINQLEQLDPRMVLAELEAVSPSDPHL